MRWVSKGVGRAADGALRHGLAMCIRCDEGLQELHSQLHSLETEKYTLKIGDVDDYFWLQQETNLYTLAMVFGGRWNCGPYVVRTSEIHETKESFGWKHLGIHYY